MQIINASNWYSYKLGEKIYFSPNLFIINLIKTNPEEKFWLKTFSAFSLLIIDNQNNEIICIRDHFGLEPFFYYYLDNKIIFGSTVPQILNNLPVKPTLNKHYLYQNLVNIYNSFPEYSDETNYLNIYRVEPAHITTIKNNKTYKKLYWNINLGTIDYKDKSEYLENFEEILNNVTQEMLQNNSNIALEYSGGMDSTAVLTALHNNGYNTELFVHVDNHDIKEKSEFSEYGRLVADYFNLGKINLIDAKDFILENTINFISDIFAGNPSYIYSIAANNVHKAIAKENHKIVFSGFGGDECASSHVPLRFCYKDYKNIKALMNESILNYREKQHYFPNNWQKFKILINLILLQRNPLSNYFKHPRPQIFLKMNNLSFNDRIQIPTLKELEYQLLIGKYSHHVRMRVEESAIIGKSLGFEYKYPLLHPKIIEFCHNIPISIKRSEGKNRLLIKGYLNKYLPETIYKKYQKIGNIVPGTLNKILKEDQGSKYHSLFENIITDNKIEFIQEKFHHDNQSKLFQNIFLACLPK